MQVLQICLHKPLIMLRLCNNYILTNLKSFQIIMRKPKVNKNKCQMLINNKKVSNSRIKIKQYKINLKNNKVFKINNRTQTNNNKNCNQSQFKLKFLDNNNNNSKKKGIKKWKVNY